MWLLNGYQTQFGAGTIKITGINPCGLVFVEIWDLAKSNTGTSVALKISLLVARADVLQREGSMAKMFFLCFFLDFFF